MQQGWIEWAKVCKLTILHDLATYPGVLIITVSSGYCYDEGSLLYLLRSSDVKWTMPQFKFCFHLDSIMSAAPAWAMIRTISPLHEDDTKKYFSLCFYSVTHMMIWLFFLPWPSPFFLAFIMLFVISFNLRWNALCVRSACLYIFTPIECQQMTVADI